MGIDEFHGTYYSDWSAIRLPFHLKLRDVKNLGWIKSMPIINKVL